MRTIDIRGKRNKKKKKTEKEDKPAKVSKNEKQEVEDQGGKLAGKKRKFEEVADECKLAVICGCEKSQVATKTIDLALKCFHIIDQEEADKMDNVSSKKMKLM